MLFQRAFGDTHHHKRPLRNSHLHGFSLMSVLPFWSSTFLLCDCCCAGPQRCRQRHFPRAQDTRRICGGSPHEAPQSRVELRRVFHVGYVTYYGSGCSALRPFAAPLSSRGGQREAPARRTGVPAAAAPSRPCGRGTTSVDRYCCSPLPARRSLLSPSLRHGPRCAACPPPRAAAEGAHARGAASMRAGGAGGAPPLPLPLALRSACASGRRRRWQSEPCPGYARCHGQRGGCRAGRCGCPLLPGLVRGAG